MANPTPPDLSNANLAFTPASYWQAGEYDPATLVDYLKQQPGLADFEDAAGAQSAVRLDADADPANEGWWITIPAAVAESEIAAAIAAYAPPGPPAPPPPTPEQVAGQMASTINTALGQLDPSTATVADVISTITGALSPYTQPAS